jgi:hypothetical protein
MVGIIIGLRHCHIGIENLDKLVLIVKNKYDVPRLGCVSGPLVKSMAEYLNVKDILLKKNEELLLDFSLFKED